MNAVYPCLSVQVVLTFTNAHVHECSLSVPVRAVCADVYKRVVTMLCVHAVCADVYKCVVTM